MAKPVFTWSPAPGAKMQEKPDVRLIRFGDGYEQRQTNGLNRSRRIIAVTFKADAQTITDIRAFLRARAGVEAFAYVHPGDSPGVYVCRDWSNESVTSGVYELTTTFEEVYES